MTVPGQPLSDHPLIPAESSGLVPTGQRESWRSFARQKVMRHIDHRIAAVSHLSIAFGVLIGVGFMLGIVINLVIWLRSRRSSFVELHSAQAGLYQTIVLVTNVIIIGIWIAVLVMLMGDSELGQGQLSIRQIFMGLWCALFPLHAAWCFGTILYGVYAGLVVASGRDFTYPIIGPRVRRRLAAREK